KAQCGGCICHRVGSVKHDEAIIPVVFIPYHLGNGTPMIGPHVGRIDGRLKRYDIQLKGEMLQRRKISEDTAEVEWHQRPRSVGGHTKSSSCIDNENTSSRPSRAGRVNL